LDQLSRNEDLQAKLAASDWDLVIFDEAHKLSAHLYGDEVKRTQRFELAELVRDRTRNLLLLTATPHNGNNEDFLLFLTLIDPDRFAGRLRSGKPVPDISDIMRRYVKENLKTFAGTRLFPKRIAKTVPYDLSPDEEALYEAVTSYVQEGMNRAKQLEEGRDKRRGLAIGFALAALQRRLASSPEAILRSLQRRLDKMTTQLELARKVGRELPARDEVKTVVNPEDFDSDDYSDDEFEQMEDEAIENAFSAESIVELEREIEELKILVVQAAKVRAADQDRKWVELRRMRPASSSCSQSTGTP
jgi:SNF2 family DNA or RNA helicase